jgi:hypothetical protein
MDLKEIASQKASEILTGKREIPTFAKKLAESAPKPEAKLEMSDDDYAQEAAGSKLLSAMESRDPKRLTNALIDALEILGISVRGSSSDKEV